MDLMLFILLMIAPITGSTLSNKDLHSNSGGVLCKTATESLRGLSIIIIIISHYAFHLNASYLGPLGGIGVTIFLFISGYGLNESARKGMTNFWRKKYFE